MMTLIARCLAAALLAVPPMDAAAPEGPATVKPVKTAEGWTLQVNGKPFYVKGISCNDAVGDKGEDLLQLVREAGANTVRIYGEATEDYLNRAHARGLKVNVGFWFNAIRLKTTESYLDAGHRHALKMMALDYVDRFKDHPALLTWTMGNEVFSFTEKEEQKEAFGAFLEDLVQEIHRRDPKHPVIYSSSHVRCLPYVKRLVPSIDILGVNVTGGAGSAVQWGARNGFDKPMLVTEFAPLGAWEQRKDANGLPYDPFDQLKAENYVSSWRQIQANPHTCVGGFAFVLGAFRNQDSLTWYNMNFGGLKRAGYWTIRELYTGEKPANQPPKIFNMQVSKVSKLKKGQKIDVAVRAMDAESDPLQYDYFITNIANDPLIVEKPVFFPAEPEVKGPGQATVRVPRAKGDYRVYVTVTDGRENIAIADRSIRVGR
jgi:hypothetical protein